MTEPSQVIIRNSFAWSWQSVQIVSFVISKFVNSCIEDGLSIYAGPDWLPAEDYAALSVAWAAGKCSAPRRLAESLWLANMSGFCRLYEMLRTSAPQLAYVQPPNGKVKYKRCCLHPEFGKKRQRKYVGIPMLEVITIMMSGCSMTCKSPRSLSYLFLIHFLKEENFYPHDYQWRASPIPTPPCPNSIKLWPVQKSWLGMYQRKCTNKPTTHPDWPEASCLPSITRIQHLALLDLQSLQRSPSCPAKQPGMFEVFSTIGALDVCSVYITDRTLIE